ncbi:S-methyl-5'-thioinosine phosphorylase [Sutterella sp.]|uniref:S-methyl-5'-thioinosine phosphorylase n=1 Tax=Sutterella sp. TaxID=1981025 RepID=UPI0026DFD03D|nr:S-methyl-5'-thioinosine phosphorylase [Sutterella sp.]MDO5531399.1 S-methyl-5'-thioinosine phosphorylase [Sutterella sp.]
MLALIGGTGFENDGIITDCDEVLVETPWGAPSAPLVFGCLGGEEVIFLRRHGARHEWAPHRIPYRANLWALKKAGATGVIGVGTVGGIGEAMTAGTLMVPDQLLDYTWGREHTYYDSPEAGVKHIDFTLPFDENLSGLLVRAARRTGNTIVEGGCYACTQGPRLETAAEVQRFARDGANVIGMTLYPECALARELELPYAGLCVSVNSAAGLRESRKVIRFEALAEAVNRAVAGAVEVVREALRLERELREENGLA